MNVIKVMGAGVLFTFLAFSCASAPAKSSDGVVLPAEMIGVGKDLAAVTAIHKAKIDIVNKAAIMMVGEKQSQLYESELKSAILNTSTPDAFVVRESIENLNRTKEGEFYVYQIKMKVNWTAIRETLDRYNIGTRPGANSPTSGLVTGTPTSSTGTSTASSDNLNADQRRARELVRGEMGGSTTTPATSTQQTPGTATTTGPSIPVSLDLTPEDQGTVTPEEQSIIRRYADSMTYMVYYDDTNKVDPALMRAAVAKANEFLTKNTMEAIDTNQIEKIKADQKKIYEESSGNDMTFLQWIAQKLNADVYVEIDVTTTSRSAAATRNYGSTNINIKLYDPSTAKLLGAVPYNSEEVMSQKSILDAQINAAQSSIFKIMPLAVEQAKKYMLKTFTRGIKYELILQNTSDSRLMSRFRAALSRRVKDIKDISSNAKETKYDVFYIGMIADLEDLIYQVADTLPGLEGMNKVVQRGKSLTMTTGL